MYPSDSEWLRENYLNQYAHNLFEVQFVYFKKHKLLGVVGNYVLVGLGDMMDCWVYFQNSSERDYEPACWKGIPLFEQIVAQHDKMSDQEIKALFGDEVNDSADCITYYRRIAVYDCIFDTLALNYWLCDVEREEELFRFTMTGLNTTEQKWKAEDYMEKLFKKETTIL